MADLASIIAHGERLARDTGLKDPTQRDAVWELLVEAFETLRSLPDRERGWLLSCERSHHPDVLIENVELAEWEETLDALSLGEKLKVVGEVKPTPGHGAIDRMDEVITWPAIIKTKNRRRDIAVLYYCASKRPTAVIRRRFNIKHRNTLYDIRDRGLAHIVVWLDGRLKKSAGLSVQTVQIVHPIQAR